MILSPTYHDRISHDSQRCDRILHLLLCPGIGAFLHILGDSRRNKEKIHWRNFSRRTFRLRKKKNKNCTPPPKKIPQFAADTLPAPRPFLETPLLGFSIKNRPPPPCLLPRTPSLPLPRADKNKKYPTRPPKLLEFQWRELAEIADFLSLVVVDSISPCPEIGTFLHNLGRKKEQIHWRKLLEFQCRKLAEMADFLSLVVVEASKVS